MHDGGAKMRRYSNGHATINDYFMMYLAKWKRVAVVLLIFWVVVTYIVISPLRCAGNADEALEFQERLRLVSSQLDALKEQHSNLIAQIRKSPELRNLKELEGLLSGAGGPSEEYETLRRRVYANTKELWYYINHELTKLIAEDQKPERLQAILDEIAERKRSLLAEQEQLAEADGHAGWRRAEAAAAGDLVQRRLRHLQHPPDCRRARKLLCNLNKGCGFGCQLHHIVYCLIFAYATERTLVLNSKGWRYNSRGWEYVFQPLSDSCAAVHGDKVVQWPDMMPRRTAFYIRDGIITKNVTKVSYDAKVISLPFIDSITQKPKFLPLAIPKDLAHRIVRFNGDPSSWWIGQMLKYILKPRPAVQRVINETMAKMNFKSPIVGVHVRRTDKVGTEAAFHHLHEYMSHVHDYFEQRALIAPVDVRRVYLATDDANVLEEARQKFPEYQFLGDAGVARAAATHRRYSPASLAGLLRDLQLLAACDHLVATFSSQVGRVAYEMMQGNRPDASTSFFSLDDIYYFGGQNAHDRLAVRDNRGTRRDVAFKVGDQIGVAGNHWNGYGRGTNKRTNVNGLIPWYKTVDHLILYPFPEYKEVPIYTDTRQNDL